MNKTEICNYALTLIGEATVTDASDPQDEPGRLISLLYDQVLFELLQSKDFECAKKRDTLAADGTDPAFGWETRYELPDDWLRMAEDRHFYEDGNLVVEFAITVNDGNDTQLDDWIIENNYILTNNTDSDEELQIVYIRKMNQDGDAGRLKPHVVKLLAYELGYKLLLKRSQNLKQHQVFMAQLQQAQIESWGVEAKNCYRQQATNTWVKARR
jgi:hypothetical protein